MAANKNMLYEMDDVGGNMGDTGTESGDGYLAVNEDQ